MKLFELSFDKIVIRFYLLMGIVIVAGFAGIWWLAILALPVFFSALMGIQFHPMRWSGKQQHAGKTDAKRYLKQTTAQA